MSEKFDYLHDKFGVSLVYNPDYNRYNNISTLMCVLDRIKSTWTCSSDNYLRKNVFKDHPLCSIYSAEYSKGKTSEYCLQLDSNDDIIGVTIGGENSWYMLGPVFFSKEFSLVFTKILEVEFSKKEIKTAYWEDVYIDNINVLPTMKIKKFEEGIINEFDTLTELRYFDNSYISDTRSNVIKKICSRLKCSEEDVKDIRKNNAEDGLSFNFSLKGENIICKKINNNYILFFK